MRKLVSFLTFGAFAVVTLPASASNVAEFPDNGSEQFSRGGAWVARASDPLATFFNPAGLAGQETKLTLQSNIIFHHTCFTRVRSQLDTTQEPLAPNPGDAFPRACNDIQPNVNPQLAFAYKITDRIGAGLAILGPSAAGLSNWPEFVADGTGALQPAPGRYLLLKSDGLVLNPSIGIGAEIVDNLRVGASFQWGMASFILKNASQALNTNNSRPADNDVKATLTKDGRATPPMPTAPATTPPSGKRQSRVVRSFD